MKVEMELDDYDRFTAHMEYRVAVIERHNRERNAGKGLSLADKIDMQRRHKAELETINKDWQDRFHEWI